MNNKTTLGQLIEKEVRRQGINITDFACLINCQRNNVYNIFERTSVDVELLGRISKVLNHNFFKDVADNLNLVEIEPETEEERLRKKAIVQMFDVVPRVLRKFGFMGHLSSTPGYLDNMDNIVPDFFLHPFFITFTTGEHFKNRIGERGGFLRFDEKVLPSGKVIYIMTNPIGGTQMVDIKLEYMTEEEWTDLLAHVLNVIRYTFLPKNMNEINYNLGELHAL